jgi:hypothetical protein
LNIGQAVEGWGLCREDGWSNASDFDAGREGEGNFGGGINATWYKQPNGLNTLPFTVYHDVFPGLRVEHHFTRNTTEREITIKMVVKNIGTATVPFITLHRMLDVDAGGTWGDDLWVKTADSVAVVDSGSPGRGVMLEAGTRNVPHLTDAGGYGGFHDISKGGEYACDMFTGNPAGGAVSSRASDYVALATYSIGTLRPGYSKTVTFIYRAF